MLKKFVKEPLVHFLFAGFLLFIYFKSCGVDNGIDSTIVVQKQDLLDFMQFQSKAFNSDVFEAKLDGLSEREKEQMLQNYIQDEVLYREALKLGLDQNDFVLKRRIIQKMEFILDDFDETTVVVKKDSLEKYYQQHQNRYFQPAQFTFTHIFFKGNALERAINFMKKVAHQKLSAAESLKYGDRFLYHRNYATKTLSFLESQFGTTFIEALSNLKADKTQWQGPIASKYGQHWIKLTHKSKASVQPLAEIENIVKKDYLNDLKKQHKAAQIQQLIHDYEVQVNW